MSIPKILDQLPIEDISHLRAAANYTLLFDKTNKQYISSYSLKVFADLFQTDNFIRVNRSLLVRKSFIKRHIKKEGKEYLKLGNNLNVSIPRRKTQKLKLEFPILFNN